MSDLPKRKNAPGGIGDDLDPKDFDKKQIQKGIKVELEHTDDKGTALDIVMDHLEEDPKYYDKLEKCEKDMEKKSFVGIKNIDELIKNSK